MWKELDELLKSVQNILRTEKLLKQEKEKRGECFNIFEIMKAQYDEVNTHSALIAGLLNPKSNHGCGKAFLEAFLDIIRQCRIDGKDLDNFFANTSEVCVYVEHSIGRVSDDFEYGGRIDILLENSVKEGKQAIIIENKIYAGDCKKQLYRYKKYAAERYKKYIILYLTLDGHSPAQYSIKGDCEVMKEGEDFYCISYRNHIIDWLRRCKEKAASIPVVRETITQYLDLILKLTHQNMENTTKKELIEKLAAKDNYPAVCRIHDVYLDVIEQICNTELYKQLKEIEEELNEEIGSEDEKFELECKIPQNWKEQYSHFFFRKKTWEHFHIGFEFLYKDFRGWFYGIAHIKEEELNDAELNVARNKIIETVEEKINNEEWRTSQWWPCYTFFTPNNLDTEEAIGQLYNGTIKDRIKDRIKDILNCIKEIEKVHF